MVYNNCGVYIDKTVCETTTFYEIICGFGKVELLKGKRIYVQGCHFGYFRHVPELDELDDYRYTIGLHKLGTGYFQFGTE